MFLIHANLLQFQNHKKAPLDKTYYVPYGFNLISSLVDSWSVDWSKSLKVIYWQSRSCEVELEVCVNMFGAVIAYHWDPYMRDSQILNANLRNSLNFIDNISTTVFLVLISSNAICRTRARMNVEIFACVYTRSLTVSRFRSKPSRCRIQDT